MLSKLDIVSKKAGDLYEKPAKYKYGIENLKLKLKIEKLYSYMKYYLYSIND